MKIFYCPQQAARNATSYSPSAAKPAAVVAHWLREGLIERADLTTFPPATREQLALAHARDYVDGVLDLQQENGFGNLDAGVAAALPYTSGALLAAARYAVQNRTTACAPTSGFHHACHDSGGGFCTFNGLMVTALALHAAGRGERVAILDLDMHFGNGTADILQRLGIDWIVHCTQGARFHGREDVGPHAQRYFDWLMRARDACQDADLVLYQAGADPHIDDPLGGLLTSAELIMRDLMVFSALTDLPLAWNLAGGYQRDAAGGIAPVLQIHGDTLRVALDSERTRDSRPMHAAASGEDA